VLEKGDHNALLRQKGIYYQMVSCASSRMQLVLKSSFGSNGLTTDFCIVSIASARSIEVTRSWKDFVLVHWTFCHSAIAHQIEVLAQGRSQCPFRDVDFSFALLLLKSTHQILNLTNMLYECVGTTLVQAFRYRVIKQCKLKCVMISSLSSLRSSSSRLAKRTQIHCPHNCTKWM
jgi:hypothetical protein